MERRSASSVYRACLDASFSASAAVATLVAGCSGAPHTATTTRAPAAERAGRLPERAAADQRFAAPSDGARARGSAVRFSAQQDRNPSSAQWDHARRRHDERGAGRTATVTDASPQSQLLDEPRRPVDAHPLSQRSVRRHRSTTAFYPCARTLAFFDGRGLRCSIRRGPAPRRVARRDDRPVAPDLFGMTIATARRHASRRASPWDSEAKSPTTRSDGHSCDPGACRRIPLVRSGRSPIAMVIVVPSTVPGCARAQLAATFIGTGLRRGKRVRRHPRSQYEPDMRCSLSGAVTVTALASDGSPIRASRHAIPSPLVLPPTTPPPSQDGSLPWYGKVMMRVDLGAEYRDDGSSPNGLCATPVIPATWRVTINPMVLDTANRGPGEQPMPTCRGDFAATDIGFNALTQRPAAASPHDGDQQLPPRGAQSRYAPCRS